jgi:8-oxo-dGTP diphosphatase
VKLYVVRHAHAGSRAGWRGDDHERPLSAKGEKQARAIADLLERGGVARLVSSPFVRCVQTFDPAAARLGVKVEVDDRLAEGRRGEDALELAGELRHEPAALCTHGDVVPDLLHILSNEGARLRDPLVWPKGSTWVLEWSGNTLANGEYVPPG